MKAARSTTKTPSTTTIPAGGVFFAVLLAVLLAVLFGKSFLPGFVHFSNDGPLGLQSVKWLQLPASFAGCWDDLNDIGASVGSYPLGLSALIRWALGPVGFAKFFPPVALFILGLGAWTFFRQLRLSPLAAVLGALAATLNSSFFACACWGVGPQEIAIGMDFFALALVVSNSPATPALVRWTRLALAGLAVGINVMEAGDLGAIFSVFVAAFVFYKSFADEGGSGAAKAGRGIGQVVIIAAFAGFIALQTVVSLVGSQISGIAGTAQDAETKARNWNWATSWSEPKVETLGLFVPGLFGYRMDTPKDMMEFLQDSYRGGNYWGTVGSDPSLDPYFEGGRKGPTPRARYGRPAPRITSAFWWHWWRPGPWPSRCGGRIRFSQNRSDGSSGFGPWFQSVPCSWLTDGSPRFTDSSICCRMPPRSGFRPNSCSCFPWRL